MSTTRLVDPDPLALSVADTIKAAQKIREKYRDVPVALKMSHETYRQLVVIRNINPNGDPITRLFGMEIMFDEEIPVGEVKEQFQ